MKDDNNTNPEAEYLEALKLEWDARSAVLRQKMDDLEERIPVLKSSLDAFRSKGTRASESDLVQTKEYYAVTSEACVAAADYLAKHGEYIEYCEQRIREFEDRHDDPLSTVAFSLKLRMVSEESRMEIHRGRLSEAQNNLSDVERFLSLDLDAIYQLNKDACNDGGRMPLNESGIEHGSDTMACRSAPSEDYDIDSGGQDQDAGPDERTEPVPYRKGGYISSISIENFKGIGEKVTIPLKPITLMFGANSAGKSTVIQALLYAHEVLNNNNPDADKTEYGGEWINLGGFQNLVHNHDLNKEIKIGFEYVLSDDGLPDYGPQRGTVGILPDELIYMPELFKPLEKIGIQFSVQMSAASTAFVSSYHVSINGNPIAVIGAMTSKELPFLNYLSLKHVIDEESGFAEVEDVKSAERYSTSNLLLDSLKLVNDLSGEHQSDEEVIADIKKYQQEVQNGFRHVNEANLPEGLLDVVKAHTSCSKIQLDHGGALPRWGKIIPFSFDDHEDWDLGENVTLVYSILSALIAGPGELIANALKEHRYIGPIRETPSRFYRPQKTEQKGRWADGMAGWDSLYSDVANGGDWFDRGQFDQLNLGYDFMPYEDAPARIIDWSHLKRNGDDETYEFRGNVKPTSASNKQTIVRMTDQKNRVEMEPCDVGTGVSQVVPVVAGAMSPGCNFLSVEQPELHLHPAIQCNLGDLFISQMHRYPERTFLLETHSEHLILRILRRIYETAEGVLPDDNLALAPDHLGVLYVEEVEDGVRIIELPVNKEGNFTRKWPNGFFAERAQEVC